MAWAQPVVRLVADPLNFPVHQVQIPSAFEQQNLRMQQRQGEGYSPVVSARQVLQGTNRLPPISFLVGGVQAHAEPPPGHYDAPAIPSVSVLLRPYQPSATLYPFYSVPASPSSEAP